MTEYVELGRVARAHGLRGELEIRLHWPGSTTLFEVEEVTLRAPESSASTRGRLCRIQHARSTPKGVLLALDDIGDRDAAEQLKGWSVCVSRAALPELEQGEYYLGDTLGAEVFTRDGQRVGRVVDLRMYPSVDALLIEREDGGRLEQPLVEPWLESVDVAAGRVVLSSLDGSLEIDDPQSGAVESSEATGAAGEASPRKRREKRRRDVQAPSASGAKPPATSDEEPTRS